MWKSKPKNFVAIIVKSITYNEEESAAALRKLVWWRTYLEALSYASQMLKVVMAEILQPQWQIDKCCNIDKQNILVTRKKKQQLWSLLTTKDLFPIYASGFQRLCWNQGRRICWSWFLVYTLAKEFSCGAAGYREREQATCLSSLQLPAGSSSSRPGMNEEAFGAQGSEQMGSLNPGARSPCIPIVTRHGRMHVMELDKEFVDKLWHIRIL